MHLLCKVNNMPYKAISINRLIRTYKAYYIFQSQARIDLTNFRPSDILCSFVRLIQLVVEHNCC